MTTNIFDSSQPAPYVPEPQEEGDFGPRLRLSIGKYEANEPPYIPNPSLVGKAILLEGLSVVETPNKYKKAPTDPDTKQAIDVAKATVVETGEVFERQRIMQSGVVPGLAKLVNKGITSTIAAVSTYESKKYGGTFVQLDAPTPDQQAAAKKYVSAPAQGSDAPF